MARLFGVCCGLAIFSAVIFSGLLVGNPVERIILRALAGLAGGLVLGNAAGWIGLALVEDNIPNEPPPNIAPTVEPSGPPVV